ncbi:MAG TPA: type II secretion system protein [Phycisphaerae bacterium]|nr:type II secretion system protein [Phycisphaerae bacterium]
MSRRTGFTLIEVLASIFAFALSATLMVPLARSRELARRSSCATNCSNIGKGLAMYTSATQDQWPWLTSSNEWSAATGAGQTKAPSAKTNYNVSALLFMLIRDGQAPGIFICPSTKDAPDGHIKTKDRKYHWDFSPYADGNAEHVSYSYQAPRTNGRNWRSGVTGASDSGLIILADRTPAYDGLKPDFNWAKPGKADPNTGMSQNHRGEYINLLYADTHVGNSTRADEGIDKDNIYSCAGLGADGKPLATSQGPGTLKLSEHRSETDSFLMGPKKMGKPAK